MRTVGARRRFQASGAGGEKERRDAAPPRDGVPSRGSCPGPVGYAVRRLAGSSWFRESSGCGGRQSVGVEIVEERRSPYVQASAEGNDWEHALGEQMAHRPLLDSRERGSGRYVHEQRLELVLRRPGVGVAAIRGGGGGSAFGPSLDSGVHGAVPSSEAGMLTTAVVGRQASLRLSPRQLAMAFTSSGRGRSGARRLIWLLPSRSLARGSPTFPRPKKATIGTRLREVPFTDPGWLVFGGDGVVTPWRSEEWPRV